MEQVEWKFSTPLEEEGVIVGSTASQEWLIPWWWMNFRLFNSYPVTFINFGDMSDKAVAWCKKRGQVLTLDIQDHFISKREEVDLDLVKRWEKMNSHVWEVRPAWFKKPFALLEAPYKKNLWLDLDCQVRGSLDPLFRDYLSQAEVAISEEVEMDQLLNQTRGLLLPNELMYNGGVIAFYHGSKLMEEWVKQSIDQNRFFIGDQQLLSRIIFTQDFSIANLPPIYNWPIAYGVNLEAVIMHWWGNHKNQIHLQIQAMQEIFFTNLSF